MTTENEPGPALDAAFVSLLAFWSEAGVDAAYADAPVDRLAEGARRLRPALRAPADAPTRAASAALFDAPAAPSPAVARIEDAGRAAEAAADLAGLQAAAEAFFGPLGAGPVLFGRGAPDAAVVVVGEAPGAEDEAEGRVFAGAPGRLLDRMLAAAGLEGRVWLTHAVLRRPPTDGPPPPADVEEAAPFLDRGLRLIGPRALLLLGEGAVRTVLGQGGGIMGLRGRRLERPGVGEAAPIPAMATFAPAFLLKQPMAKRRAWEDLLTLAAWVDRPDPGA